MMEELFEELIDQSIQIEIKEMNNRLEAIEIEKKKLLGKNRELNSKIANKLDRIDELNDSLQEATNHIANLRRRAWQTNDQNVSELRKQVLVTAKKAKAIEEEQAKAAKNQPEKTD